MIYYNVVYYNIGPNMVDSIGVALGSGHANSHNAFPWFITSPH